MFLWYFTCKFYNIFALAIEYYCSADSAPNSSLMQYVFQIVGVYVPVLQFFFSDSRSVCRGFQTNNLKLIHIFWVVDYYLDLVVCLTPFTFVFVFLAEEHLLQHQRPLESSKLQGQMLILFQLPGYLKRGAPKLLVAVLHEAQW